MNDSALYELCDVRYSYESDFTLAVKQLTVRRGETLCLLGPTGAGKSTLLRLLAGLESPTNGEVRFDDDKLDAADLPLAVRRRLAMLHQRPLLLTGSVRLNVEYGLRLRRAADRSACDAALERLGLQELAEQPVETLSGGQVQLVALARTLVVEPEVLLLDEPTESLDPTRVALVEDLVREAQARTGMTVVWATHNLFQARRVAGRVAMIWDGELIEVAGTEEFFEAPADARTADFVQGRAVY